MTLVFFDIIHMYISVYVCIYLCICVCIYVCMYAPIYLYVCVYIGMYIRLLPGTRVPGHHTYVHMYICMCKSMTRYVYMTSTWHSRAFSSGMVYIQVHMYICV